MPIARFQMPDGRVARFEVPDGTSPEDATSMMEAHFAALKPVDTSVMADPNPAAVNGSGIMGKVSDFLDNTNAAVGGAVTRGFNGYQQAANTVGQAVRSVLPQAANTALDRANTSIGLGTSDQATQTTNASIAEHARLDKPLQATAGGKFGDALGTGLMLAPAALAGGGMVPMIATNALMSGLMTPGDASTRGMAALGGGTGAAGGKAFGDYIGNALTKQLVAKTAAGDAAKMQNAGRDATLNMGRENGLVVPPGMVDRGMSVGNILEGIAGKTSVAQNASVKNQPVFNKMARTELGMAADAPLTQSAMQDIRTAAAPAYEAVKKFGTIQTDPAYTAAVRSLNGGTLAKDFPELANGEVANLVSALDKPGFSSDSAVELLKKLRFDGQANSALQDPAKKALGAAQKDAARAVEGVLDRNLKAAGQGDLLKSFQDARVQIAKTYSLGKAINDSTGNVIPGKLAAQLNKGKPLSGGLEDIAQFGAAFPQASKAITASTPMFSPLDSMASTFAGLGGTMMHGPIAGLASAALPLARPLARAAVLNPLMQKLLVNPQYGPGLLGRQMPQIADNDLMRMLLRSGAAAGTTNALQK
jgi:hypothetical protein